MADTMDQTNTWDHTNIGGQTNTADPTPVITGTAAPTPANAQPQVMAARAVGASKVYGEKSTQVVALDDVTVDFPKGRFTSVMGPSGSGKSTLMHCLAGLDTLTSGEIMIGDANLSTMSEKELTLLRRQKVGFVFQAFNLIPTLSARENILLPLELAGDKPDQGWFDKVISAVGLKDRLSHKPDELSGGQQQRVAVSRALASRPEIIFADEPTGNLDSATGEDDARHRPRSHPLAQQLICDTSTGTQRSRENASCGRSASTTCEPTRAAFR